MANLKSNLARLSFVAIFFVLAACSAAPVPQTGGAQNPTQADAVTTAPTVAADQPTAVATEATSATTAAQAPSSGGLRYDIVAADSKAIYKAREQLANMDLPNDVVGTSKDISGSVVLKADGTIDSSQSKVTVGLANLQTDRSMRDNFVRRNVLNTDQYPSAVFVPSEVSGLPSPLPQSGDVSFKLTGNLTIKDVTKPVTWDVKGSVSNGKATGTATTTFKFEDFNLTQPKVPVVLSIEDHITLEADVTLQPAQ
jgi:polyisoprenoid-binding protein YceI